MTTTATASPQYLNSRYTVEEFKALSVKERYDVNRDEDWKAKQKKLGNPTAAPISAPATEPEPAATPEAEDESDLNFDALLQEANQALDEVTPAPEGEDAGEPEGVIVEAVEAAVMKTTDYSIFRHYAENRPVNPAQVRNLVAEITKKNLLSIRPIDVSMEMEVVDGQHRLEAAKELGLPIYFRMSDIGGEDIANLNTANKNWANTEYLHYWAKKGKHHYQVLDAFMKDYPWLSFSNAKNMISKYTGNSSPEFRAGTWEAGDVETGKVVAALILRIRQETAFKQANDSRFVSSVHYCVARVEGFEPDRFMEKVLELAGELEPCGTHKKYLELFDRIYNYRVRTDKRVNFPR